MIRLRRTTFLRKVNNNEKDYDGCKWAHQSALFVNLNFKKYNSPMRKLFIILLSALSLTALAQQKTVAVLDPICRDNPAPEKSPIEKEEEVAFVTVEEMPEFPGGQQALFKFLSENVKYPAEAYANGIQGRVICQFVVNKDGSIVDVKVVRSGGDPSLDKEAVRVIQSMPKWKPGKQRGKYVRVKYTVPVNFKIPTTDGAKMQKTA